jgi:uncharacterized protein (DUF1501 family)
MEGGPAACDTFDYQEGPDSQPLIIGPETISGVLWPAGIMPRLAQFVPDIAVVRSMEAWDLDHAVSQRWLQTGRSPGSPLAGGAPNLGAVVAAEKESDRNLGQVFPGFVCINHDGAVEGGFLRQHAPLKINGAAPPLSDTGGFVRFQEKFNLLMALDEPLRKDGRYGNRLQEFDESYQRARKLSFHNLTASALRLAPQDTARYGATAFGNACLMAAQLLAANGGTRYIQIAHPGWDMHAAIYTSLPPLAREFDQGLAALIADLKRTSLFGETLIVAMGEFGRAAGALNSRGGRDHHRSHAALMAGGGIRGGRALEKGSRTVRHEDIAATIYSALGIDWRRHVADGFGPITELWN